jgi:hypothetical protein
LHRRLRWSVAQLKDKTPDKRTMPGLRPRWAEESDSTPKLPPMTEAERAAEGYPPNALHPPFCLDPDEFPEPGSKADIPAILTSRRKKQMAKVEARRAVKRRRLEELRS